MDAIQFELALREITGKEREEHDGALGADALVSGNSKSLGYGLKHVADDLDRRIRLLPDAPATKDGRSLAERLRHAVKLMRQDAEALSASGRQLAPEDAIHFVKGEFLMAPWVIATAALLEWVESTRVK